MPAPLDPSVIAMVRALLREETMTNADIARRVGVDPSLVGRIKKGVRKTPRTPRKRALDAQGRKLDPCDVLDIRRRLEAGESGTAIAAAYGITSGAVSMIRTRRRWAWL